MDQPDGDPKILFDALIKDMEVRKAAREFDNVDHSGGRNIPTPAQVKAAAAIMANARQLRRILSG